MDDQNKNLILATVLSLVVLIAWTVFFAPEVPEQPITEEQLASETAPGSTGQVPVGSESSETSAIPGLSSDPAENREAALSTSERVPVESDRLSGSISLVGGRFDDLHLTDYHVTIEPDSPTVTLLTPQGTQHAYYALFGWAAAGGLAQDAVPGPDTPWQLESGGELTPDSPVTLVWDNGAGLVFRRVIQMDDEYMFRVTQSVANTGAENARMAPYGMINIHGEPPDSKNFFILHEGAILQTGETLEEVNYNKLRGLDPNTEWGGLTAQTADVTGNGWLGFTGHYWMTTLIPSPEQPFTAALQYTAATDTYSSISRLSAVDVAPGETLEVTQQFFAGAKEWEVIRDYQDKYGVYKFVDSIDWGWFYFLTKPIFRVLHWLHGYIGNMGWSIIALTLVLKAVLFPLAFKSYVSMAKMKELQPEIEKIKERVGDDRQKLQAEMMALYKKEKANPAAGCLPMLLQIPIFFSLYKVIFVTIELRHAPWFGPFQDLSAPDPTSIINLFGLLPWAAPAPDTILALIFIGIMPLLLGISMFLQQKLNPAPTDPTQAMIIAWMPWIFMFMLGGFASGLVLYWITNNTITFIQQYSIMRSQGYKPDIMGNIRGPAKESRSKDSGK